MIARLVASVALLSVSSLAPSVSKAQTTGAAGLPEAPGHEMVQAICTGCHQANMITRSSGYTRDGWREIIGTMIDFSASPETRDRIVEYLATQFPPNTKRVSRVLPGPARITFEEWQTPTLGQRTRDPVEAPDGAIWWVGQFANVMGRLDPKTGGMKEYQLPPKSLPHSVSIDAAGNPWFTGNGNGTIGKLDAKTGEITVYKMPDPAARDPHTAEFDRNGILWFSLQQSNMVGRLDPKTGDIKLAKTVTPGAKPYGVKIAADGTPWFSCNGSNCLMKLDPATMQLSEVKLPTPGTTVRRLDISEDGIIWYVNSSKGGLGRYNPRTGEIKEWLSPSGPESHPYGIAS